MVTHFLRITAVTAAIILCTLLPFLPGRYDSLAVPLSGMSQLFGKVGLSLVPVGALWMASQYWKRLAGKQHIFAIETGKMHSRYGPVRGSLRLPGSVNHSLTRGHFA